MATRSRLFGPGTSVTTLGPFSDVLSFLQKWPPIVADAGPSVTRSSFGAAGKGVDPGYCRPPSGWSTRPAAARPTVRRTVEPIGSSGPWRGFRINRFAATRFDPRQVGTTPAIHRVMKKSLVVTTALAVLPLLTGTLLADDLPPLALGSRVRVTTNRELIGKLVARDDQSLTLHLGDNKDPVVVPRAAIKRLEQSLRPRNTQAQVVGGWVGAAIAIALGVAAGSDCFGFGCQSESESYRMGAGFALLNSAWLVPTGVGIGNIIGRERWRRVPVERIKVGLTPTPGRGVGAAVSFSF